MNDQFEKYLNNELSDRERSDLLEKLKTDQAISEDFENYLLAREVLVKTEENKIRNIIAEQKPSETPVIPLRRKFAIAASVLLIVGFAIVFYLLSLPSANEQLFQAYFEPGTYYGNYTRSNIDPTGNLDKGVAFYLDGQLDQAETYLKEVKQKFNEQQLQQQANLYLGLIALQKNQDEKALEILEQLSESNQVYDDTMMDWILALAYLKNNMPDKAAILLNNICKVAESKYAIKSCELWQELNGA